MAEGVLARRVGVALALLVVGCRSKTETLAEAPKALPAAELVTPDAAVAEIAPFVIADVTHLRSLQIVGDYVYGHDGKTARFSIASHAAREDLPMPSFRGWEISEPVVDGERVFYLAWNWIGATRPNILVQGPAGMKPVLEFEFMGPEYAVDVDSVYVTSGELSPTRAYLGAKIVAASKNGGPTRTLVRAPNLGAVRQSATHLHWFEIDGAIHHVRRLAKKGGVVEHLFDAPAGALFVFGPEIFYRIDVEQDDGPPRPGALHRFTGGGLKLVPGMEGAEYVAHDGDELFVATATEVRASAAGGGQTIAKLDAPPCGLVATKRWLVWSTTKGVYGLKR